MTETLRLGLSPAYFLAIFFLRPKTLIFYRTIFFVVLFAHRSDCGKVSAASPPPGTASRRGG
jgi:hypothetical protein